VRSPFALAALPSAYRSERRVACSDASHWRGVTTATEASWSHAVSALARQQPTCPRGPGTRATTGFNTAPTFIPHAWHRFARSPARRCVCPSKITHFPTVS
jgi:hypothetical protein